MKRSLAASLSQPVVLTAVTKHINTRSFDISTTRTSYLGETMAEQRTVKSSFWRVADVINSTARDGNFPPV